MLFGRFIAAQPIISRFCTLRFQEIFINIFLLTVDFWFYLCYNSK